jgi:hypothetical protein
MPEENLLGGNVTPVTRSGDVICRPASFWTPNVHALLRHLTGQGLAFVPRPLGTDDRGRELLTYLPGTMGTYPDGWPSMDEEVLELIGRMLRQIHDATVDFVAPVDGWRYQVGAPRTGDVVCHNDFAPYNMLFRSGDPVGVIDWDFAAPAPREWDVAHALWRFIPLYPPARWWMGELSDFPPALSVRRMRVLCRGYDIAPTQHLLDVVEERQRVVFQTIKTLAKAGDRAFADLWNGAEAEDGFEELAWFRTVKSKLAADLDS